MSRCTRCKSIWVCWNWFVSPDEALHECWNCAACWHTSTEVTDGVPYWLLKYVGRYFVDNKLFEQNLAKDMESTKDWLDDEPWDDAQK